MPCQAALQLPLQGVLILFTLCSSLLSHLNQQIYIILVQVLLGYYEISSVMSGPIQATINPAGDEHSHELRVWNKGDQRMKLLAFTRASLAHTEIDGNDTLLNSVWLASEDLDAADDAATAEALTFSSQQAV